MISTVLANRIEMLPSELQQQVADFVDFLLFKHRTGKHTMSEEFTEEQKEELMRLWGDYLDDPDDVITLEVSQTQTKAKYGL
ncbi:MAG: DUF2281 domain-containing protein [Saprospiraceae bacterium]|nr:DUF2281 domain-containing protein [Saprospiraceae bacterium]MCF8252300.1 DUF2281 domain-containing protein [Saprospiraceae bacterium]MCF8282097.1 DUF2281 domain-containing protein [Bacteroidales bacterium]MCF8313941.1 DUF2281 domain-containing protein [Saprospiraceae bacterium]MCF8442652.1 DUF2281 domain-containing protein [Saprospiraceae bacterium]